MGRLSAACRLRQMETKHSGIVVRLKKVFSFDDFDQRTPRSKPVVAYCARLLSFNPYITNNNLREKIMKTFSSGGVYCMDTLPCL